MGNLKEWSENNYKQQNNEIPLNINTNQNYNNFIYEQSIDQSFLGLKHKRSKELKNSSDSNDFKNRNKIKKIENSSEQQLLNHSNRSQKLNSELIKENKELKNENDEIKILKKKFDEIKNELKIKVNNSLNKINNKKEKTEEKIKNKLRTSIIKFQEKKDEKINLLIKDLKKKIEVSEKKLQELESLYSNKYKNKKNNEDNNEIKEGIKCKRCFTELINGIIYKCTFCNNYYLCQKCIKENLESFHPHKFLEFWIKQEPQISNEDNNYNIINININKLNEDKNKYIKNNLEYNNNFINQKKEDFLKNKDINEIKNNDNNIIKYNIILNKTIEFDNYSYKCLTKNLYFSVNKGTKEYKFNLILKNNGIFPWPRRNTFLIKDIFLSDNIDIDKIFLEPLNPNKQTEIYIPFKNMEKLLPGKYKIYLDFYAKNKNFGNKIFIVFEILEKKENKKIAEFRAQYLIDESLLSDEQINKALESNNDNFKKAFESFFHL